MREYLATVITATLAVWLLQYYAPPACTPSRAAHAR